MKKILFLVVVGICLASCGWRNNSNTHDKKIDNIDVATRFEYDGHKYILFMRYGNTNYTNQTGVVHDPDCPCHNKER